jgi:diapolycopene oxygenase
LGRSRKAVVVGAGIAGIASSIRLALKGFDVTVFESNTYPGGKLTSITRGEYRFDAGPSLFTLPHLVDELFTLANRNPRDYFNYHTSKTACHYFFEDGTFLPFSADEDTLLKDVKEILKVDTVPLKEHLARSRFIYERTRATFLEKSLHRRETYLSREILSTISAIPNLQIFTTMHQANERRLNHPKLVQIFDRYATYNGSDPYKAPGILQIIPHLEHGIGTFFPTEGMHGITTALVRLAEELGVVFHYGSKVNEISETTHKIQGVKVNNEFYPAEIVVCNSDVKPAYKQLLKTIKAPEKTMKQEPSSSAMIFYWGIKDSFPELDLHNIFFSENYKEEFSAIFDRGEVSEDPTVYVHVSSKLVKSDAPEGCESWFILVNVPSNSGQNWEEFRIRIREMVIQKLSRMLKRDISTLIEVEDYLDPVRIEQRTSSFAGALYGASSNDRMTAFFRHPNFSKVKGLYFVGGSVHPGGGIPLCLLSARIATDLIK